MYFFNLILKGYFPGYDILCWQFSFLQHFQAIFHCPIISIERLAVSFIVVILKSSNHFPSLVVLSFFFSSFTMMCLCVDFFLFILLGFLCFHFVVCSVLKNCHYFIRYASASFPLLLATLNYMRISPSHSILCLLDILLSLPFFCLSSF